MPLLYLVILIALLAAIFAVGTRDPAARSDLLKHIGFVLMGVEVMFGTIFIAGYALADPGGWKGAALVSLWLVPLAVLCALAWRRPDVAAPLLAGLTALVVALSVWFAFGDAAWRSFEDRNGPVRALAVFVVAGAVAVLGWWRPASAGLMLVALSVAPYAATIVRTGTTHLAATSLGVVALPALLAGVLYLLSARLHAHR